MEAEEEKEASDLGAAEDLIPLVADKSSVEGDASPAAPSPLFIGANLGVIEPFEDAESLPAAETVDADPPELWMNLM